MRSLLVLPALLLAFGPTAHAGENLGKRYKATLDFSEEGIQRDWTCGPDDVWRLSSFAWEGGPLELAFGPSTVVFGVHEKNVVWAALLPDEPGTVAHPVGDGEHPSSVFLRFHPSRVGELFPTKTVEGQGPERAILHARRMYSAKISSGWQADAWPVIPKKSSIVFDCEVTEGRRRYYMADLDQGTVDCSDAFKTPLLHPLVPIEPEVAVEAFEAAWKAFDEEYPKFDLVPEVDWADLRERYRPWAEEARTTFEAGATIALLLEHLRDLHVWVKAGDEWMPGFQRIRPWNGNWNAAATLIGPLQKAGGDLSWGRTSDDIAYLNVDGLGDEELPKLFDEALERLDDTWAAIVDLRYNGGGNEVLAQEIAGRFLDEPEVYATNRYRAGPAHDDLGPVLERVVHPRPWRYERPVIALIGQRTMSSAESFAMMLAQGPDVTTMGDRTAGSSANPRRLSLPGGIEANLPRWNDMDPEGHPIEHVGFAPDIEVEVAPGELDGDHDPVLEAALEKLRKISKGRRKPARR